MQTRKKVVARNGPQEHASPKFCRPQKKVTVVAERKVKELITSARKQKSGGIRSTKIKVVEETNDLNSAFALVQDEVVNGTSLDDKRSSDQPAECVPDTIFSPAYHHPKDGCGAVTDKVDFMKFFRNNNESAQNMHGFEESKADTSNCQASSENQLESVDMEMAVTFTRKFDKNADTTNRSSASVTQDNDARVTSESNQTNKFSDDKYNVVGNLSSEVSAIYLAMQNSKLECVDEHSQDSISTEDCEEPDDSDEFDDFDPYTFIKDLPDLSAVVPKFRPVLLPKQTRSCPLTTLVLDLDGTVH